MNKQQNQNEDDQELLTFQQLNSEISNMGITNQQPKTNTFQNKQQEILYPDIGQHATDEHYQQYLSQNNPYYQIQMTTTQQNSYGMWNNNSQFQGYQAPQYPQQYNYNHGYSNYPCQYQNQYNHQMSYQYPQINMNQMYGAPMMNPPMMNPYMNNNNLYNYQERFHTNNHHHGKHYQKHHGRHNKEGHSHHHQHNEQFRHKNKWQDSKCRDRKRRQQKIQKLKQPMDHFDRLRSDNEDYSSSQQKDIKEKKYEGKVPKGTKEQLQLFYAQLESFMQKNKVIINKRIQIRQLINTQQTISQCYTILYNLQYLYERKYNQYFGVFGLAKRIVKNKLNFQKLITKLDREIYTIQKKRKKQEAYYTKYPNPKQIQFLQWKDMFQLQNQKPDTIYLVDGNNVLVTNNKFRKYFQSYSVQDKVQAQVRLRWLIHHAIDAYLFFDDKFDKEIEEWLQTKLVDEPLDNVQVIYARKDQTYNEIADQKIIEKLTQLSKTVKQRQIILVTADRILSQQCINIHPIKKTSGKQFFKFLKKRIKDKYYSDPTKKSLIRKIINRN